MQTADYIRLTLNAVFGQRMRSLLTALGIAVGIAAVVLLTSIGEGVHRFMIHEFTQFGTHLIAINPGRTTTHGVPGGVIANVRPMTLGDAEAIGRLPQVDAMVPVVQGNALAAADGRTRRTTVFGTGPALPAVWQARIASGRFLPHDDARSARAFAVLGARLRNELFGDANPLGQRIRVGGETFRIIGVLAPKGQILGIDLDDAIYIPAGRALALFNRDSLMEIDVTYRAGTSSGTLARRITALLKQRHGREDFTLTTQEDMLATLNNILGVVTLAVGALGGISLLVGAVGIFTIMTIAVNERTAEIGLLRAIGARRSQVLSLFLGEAVLLSTLGGLAGLAIGLGGAWLLHLLLPALPVHTPWAYLFGAELSAALIGLLAGGLPARHAARLDPLTALREE
ncbi:peptide ABC transporter permease [Acidihalobacter yilgarnensis]|uniref:Peptide ABC transporter permease n=1 Tax=Acidihalobacter yilgarnensis TaxID=2819280 RepID=A0A1D8IL36_9GAMM|nr:ABC transporter permease [Acidihalobacter yilgarnensis]AOU97189.1 peptide ABC transporter permease [Acidihalobacter yilgarnensis]